MFIPILVASLLDPIWQVGGGIVVLIALILTLTLRSSEVHLTAQQKQRGTVLVGVGGLCCMLVLSGGILWVHVAQTAPSLAATNDVQHAQPSLSPTADPAPQSPLSPTPTPFPVLQPSTVQVLTTWCTAINRQDSATVWRQYAKVLQQQLLANKAQTAQAQYQRKFVHCTVSELNEHSADGYLLLTTVDGQGNGDGIERLYQLTLSVENHAWKITTFFYCLPDGCLETTHTILP